MTLPLPLRTTIWGQDVVLVAAELYEGAASRRDKLADPRSEAERIIAAMLDRPGRASPILDDREIAAFLIEAIGKTPDADVLADCVARFGPARSPSAAGLGRFAAAVRAIRAAFGAIEPDAASREAAELRADVLGLLTGKEWPNEVWSSLAAHLVAVHKGILVPGKHGLAMP